MTGEGIRQRSYILLWEKLLKASKNNGRSKKKINTIINKKEMQVGIIDNANKLYLKEKTSKKFV